MADSRFGDVLIESGASASESINQVTNGSHYNRDMRAHGWCTWTVDVAAVHQPVTGARCQDARCEASAMSQLFKSVIEFMSSPACIEFVQRYSVLKNQYKEWRSRKKDPVLHGIVCQCVDTVEFPGGSAVDLKIEQTISRSAKTALGILGLRHFHNLFAVRCHFVSCNGWSIAELFHVAPMLDFGGIMSQF